MHEVGQGRYGAKYKVAMKSGDYHEMFNERSMLANEERDVGNMDLGKINDDEICCG